MTPDPDQVKAEAVRRLRQALVTTSDIASALRWSWYRNPVFSTALFTESVRQWFGAGCDVRALTRFVGRARAVLSEEASGFPSREAEALLRAALGEVGLLDAVDPGQFSYPELAIVLLGQLFREWQPTPEQVNRLFDRVALVARGTTPALQPLEEDWFAAGMPDSPFAVPLDEGRADYRPEG
jgi:hypothetical protein